MCIRDRYETAVGIATEQINAQEAFIKGLIVFTGDHQKLIDAGDVFAALNPILMQCVHQLNLFKERVFTS